MEDISEDAPSRLSLVLPMMTENVVLTLYALCENEVVEGSRIGREKGEHTELLDVLLQKSMRTCISNSSRTTSDDRNFVALIWDSSQRELVRFRGERVALILISRETSKSCEI